MRAEDLFLEEANLWTKRAEEHMRLADFCHEQASRLLGHVAVGDESRPELVVLEGGKS